MVWVREGSERKGKEGSFLYRSRDCDCNCFVPPTNAISRPWLEERARTGDLQDCEVELGSGIMMAFLSQFYLWFHVG